MLRYVAHPDEVETVHLTRLDPAAYNLKRRPADAVVVQSVGGGRPWVISRALLFADPFAAAIESARLAEAIA